MRHRMTGLKFEKANFILSTKEKLPIRQTAVSGIFMLISCVYVVFILYLSCVISAMAANYGIETLAYFVSYN